MVGAKNLFVLAVLGISEAVFPYSSETVCGNLRLGTVPKDQDDGRNEMSKVRVIEVKGKGSAPVNGLYVYQIGNDGQERDLSDMFRLKRCYPDSNGNIIVLYKIEGLVGAPINADGNIVIRLNYSDNTSLESTYNLNVR